METIRVPPLEFLVWDVSGQERLRTFWRHYYHGTTGIVFVVDSHDVERLPIAKRELHGILKEEELNEAVLLIIANKTDLPNAVGTERLSHELDLQSLRGRVMHIQPAVAQKGTGLKEGLVWLAKAMKAHSKQQARLQQSGGSGVQATAVQPTLSFPTAAANSQQPAYNYQNPYDSQTLNSTASNSMTQQQQQPVAVAAASSGSLHSTAIAIIAQPATASQSTAASAPSSASSMLSTAPVTATLTPATVHSSQPTSSAPSSDQRQQQPDLSSTSVQPASSSSSSSSSVPLSVPSSAAGDLSLPLSTSDVAVSPAVASSGGE